MTGLGVWLLRRLVIAPAVILLAVALWVLLPLWLIVVAALVPVLPGRWRLLRILWLTVVWVTWRRSAALRKLPVCTISRNVRARSMSICCISLSANYLHSYSI